MTHTARTVLALGLLATLTIAQSVAPPPKPAPRDAAPSTPDVPDRFGPVPGTTAEDLARWEAMLRDAFLDTDNSRPARLTTIAALDSIDIVDLTPAILNVGRAIELRDPEAYRGVADLYRWWQVRTVRVPTFVWLPMVRGEESLVHARKTNEALGMYWNSYVDGTRKHAALREKIEGRRAARPSGVFVPSVPPVDGDASTLAEDAARLIELSVGLRDVTSPDDPADAPRLADAEHEVRAFLEEAGPIAVGPALIGAMRGARVVDRPATARLLDLWSQSTGGVPAVDFPTAPDATAERLAELERLASWLEATIRDPQALTAWRAAVANASR